jgi:hypothetical protein
MELIPHNPNELAAILHGLKISKTKGVSAKICILLVVSTEFYSLSSARMSTMFGRRAGSADRATAHGESARMAASRNKRDVMTRRNQRTSMEASSAAAWRPLPDNRVPDIVKNSAQVWRREIGLHVISP